MTAPPFRNPVGLMRHFRLDIVGPLPFALAFRKGCFSEHNVYSPGFAVLTPKDIAPELLLVYLRLPLSPVSDLCSRFRVPVSG